jgi:hypothetical protein
VGSNLQTADGDHRLAGAHDELGAEAYGDGAEIPRLRCMCHSDDLTIPREAELT